MLMKPFFLNEIWGWRYTEEGRHFLQVLYQALPVVSWVSLSRPGAWMVTIWLILGGDYLGLNYSVQEVFGMIFLINT